MSLVNYGASSSSEESDADEETPQVKPSPAPEPKPTNQKKSLFSSLPPPKGLPNKLPLLKSSSNRVSGSPPNSVGPQKKSSLFSSLPPPKSSGTSISEKRQSAGLKLPPPKKKAQPVKISLPALPDPDSDEDEPVTKKAKPVQGVAGLFAQLPKPKHAFTKDSNRIMIPYTLTKKKPPPKPTQPVKKTVQKAVPAPNKTSNTASLVTGYDDDDEDDDDNSSFFSLDKKDVIKPIVPESTTSASVKSTNNSQNTRTSSEHIAPNKINKSNEKQIEKTVTSASELQVVDNESESSSVTESGNSDAALDFNSSSQDAPLSFKAAETVPVYGSTGGAGSGDSDAPLSFRGGSQQQYGYNQQAGGSGYAAEQYSGEYSYPYGAYNQPYTGEDDQPVGSVEETAQVSQQQQPGSYVQDKEFQRMMGKHNRGKEAIDIIDVTADDQRGPNPGTEWMLKSMTEEKEYRSNLKKEQLPTSQQKRKHQITYLAQQAKERELALKNQWANNRMTRKETQAKYGF